MYGQFYPQYQPQYQIPDMSQYRPQPQTMNMFQNGTSLNQDERIWVQGESSANAYLMAPNSFVRLWDSTRPVFYEKRTDASGKPSIVAYEYHSNTTQSPNTSENKEMINTYEEQIKALESRLNALEERMDEYGEQSFNDDTAVPEIPERVQRKSTTGSRKANPRG